MGALLPSDAVLLPLNRGVLLVSRDHAKFCRVPPQYVDCIDAAMQSGNDALLPRDLLDDLTRHGFGGPAREPPAIAHSVQLQLTNQCNLACAFCCTNSGLARRREVTFETLLAVLRDVLKVYGPGTRIGILGGEPLLVPWALDLAERVIDMGLSLTFYTNGTRLANPEAATRLAVLVKRGADVRVSLGGASETSCDAESGGKRFESAIAGIHAMAAAAALPQVDVMLLPQHVEAIAQNLQSFRKRLPKGTRISLGVLYESGREQGERVFGSRAALESALDEIALEAGELIPAVRRSPITNRREGCTCALGHHLHVRSDGALFTCFKMEEPVGHLDQSSFGQACRRLSSSITPATKLTTCGNCPLATLCGAGCRAEGLRYTGNGAEPLCGPWRIRVLSELLAEDHTSALEWPLQHLLSEAHARGIEAPAQITPAVVSRHLVEAR